MAWPPPLSMIPLQCAGARQTQDQRPLIERPDPVARPVVLLMARAKLGRRNCFFQARGRKADNAGVPAFGRRHDDRGFAFLAHAPLRPGPWLLQPRAFRSPGACGSCHPALGRGCMASPCVVSISKAKRIIGMANAARCIEARAQHEAQCIGIGPAFQSRHISQGRKAQHFRAAP